MDKNKFHAELLTGIRTAWENRATEANLYPVWTRISETFCTVMDPGPHKTMFTKPQYPLKKQGNEKNSSDPSNATEEPKSSDPSNVTEKPKSPLRIPDFARLVDEDHRAQGIETGPMTSQRLVDMTEIKPLNSDEQTEPWGTQEARAAAAGAIPSCLFQVYSTAMAAFTRNPKWMEVYVTIMIGIYFTQLHWKRPSKEILRRTPTNFRSLRRIPHRRLLPHEHGSLMSDLEDCVQETKHRVMPDILCWNEPIVHFGDGCDVTSPGAKAQLTPLFLWCMRQPLKHHRKTTFDRCWLSAPRDRPQEVDTEAIVRCNTSSK